MRLKQAISSLLSTDQKNALKRLAWRNGIGTLFRKISSNQQAFEEVFKRPPRSLMVFPTNLCNALCSFCAYPTNTDPKKSMPNAIAFKSIDDFISMGGSELIDFTTNLGDPLVDPGLPDKLAYAKQSGVKQTSFYTNGILLDRPGLIEKIVPNLDALHISLPGLDRENYKQIFKVDKAEKVLRGILKLAEYRKLTGLPGKIYLEIRANRPAEVVMRDEGMLQLKPYLDACILEIRTFFTEYDNWSGIISDDNMTGSMSLKPVAEAKRDVPCQALFQNQGVLPDGHVRACSCWYINTNYDKLTLPSVVDKPLREILFGDEHRLIMREWIDGSLPPPCNSCSVYQPASFSLSDLAAMARLAIISP